MVLEIPNVYFQKLFDLKDKDECYKRFAARCIMEHLDELELKRETEYEED